jgi:hypothetical protein
MRKHLQGLDHVVLRVADLDRAAEDFADMGFTLSPRGTHTLGTQNHCLMFGFDYLELLWVPPGVAPPFYSGDEQNVEQVVGLALKTDDAAYVHQAWDKAGLHPDALLSFSRPVEVEPQVSQDARFKLVGLPAERSPGVRTFACQHFTPKLVWRPGYRRHRNHVVGINKVVIQSDDPAAVATLWGRVFDVPPFPIPGGYSVTTGAAPVVVLAADALHKQLPGVGLPESSFPTRLAALYLSTSEVRDAASILGRSGRHPVALPDGSVAVHAGEAHGVAMVFK